MSVIAWLKSICEIEKEYHKYPLSMRAARYPNGAVHIQGEYTWSKGLSAGSTWKDLPLINVDEDGKEI